MTVLDRTPEEHERWMAFRAGGITATDVADAANGTYGGAYAVVARKLGVVPPEEENDAMRRGHRWQPVIADAVHTLTGLWVVGEESWCQHPDLPHHRATVDGMLADAPEVAITDVLGLLETKTRGVHVRPNRDRWFDQVQWQLHVVGVDRALVAEATIDDDRDQCLGVRLHEVEADPDRQATLVELAERLWAWVEMAALPEPDSPDCLPIVKAVHAEADPAADDVDLTSLADDVARLAAIKEAEKAVKDEAQLLEARIRAAVGDATRGRCDGFTVSVSKPTQVITDEAEAELLAARPDLGRLVLDRDRAKAEAPELYELARRPQGARRLSVRATQGTP